MIKRFVALLGITILVVSLRTDALAQNAINATGSWSMTPSGEAFANGQVKVRQDGSAVVGTYGQKRAFRREIAAGRLQVDATWNDSRGAGWMTIVFAATEEVFRASGDARAATQVDILKRFASLTQMCPNSIT